MYSEDESTEERNGRLEKDQIFDSIVLKEKRGENIQNEKMCLKPAEPTPTPIIMIQTADDDEEDIDNIEIAKIESVYERSLTPEGNVKYKNYKVLTACNLPIRMYTPTGDIHMTPKKGKAVPKFEMFDDFDSHRERLVKLIEEQSPFSEVLKAIIKPSDRKQKTIEALRKSNVSSLGDYIDFINTANYPSPPGSIFSEDADVSHNSSSSPESNTTPVRKFIRSRSIDQESTVKKSLTRQNSVPSDGINRSQMCLSDELNEAEKSSLEYNYANVPVPVCPEYKATPMEAKKISIRNFVQRNMILQSENRDRLAKMALAIEEDNDDDFSFTHSARVLENRVEAMLDEIKELKGSLIGINEDFKANDRKVLGLLSEAKKLSIELELLQYLDDIITLMNEDPHIRSFKNKWPFVFPNENYVRPPDTNLIV